VLAAAGKIAVSIALLLAVAAPVGVVLARADHSPVVSRYRTDARPVSWSDRIFLNRPIASGWLSARGVRYVGWAARHPIAAKKIARTGNRPSRQYVNAPTDDLRR
jgi:hypothetical protein